MTTDLKAHIQLAFMVISCSLNCTFGECESLLDAQVEQMGGFIPSKLYDCVSNQIDDLEMQGMLFGFARQNIMDDLDWFVNQYK